MSDAGETGAVTGIPRPAGCLADVPCLVLAGGLGTRLAGVVADRPKCLAPIRGRPFLAYQLASLAAAGVRRVVVCTGHLAEQVEACFGRSYAGMALEYSREPGPLGTGGAVRLAIQQLPEAADLLVVNGDSFVEADMAAACAAYRVGDRAATIVLVAVADTARYGRVEIGGPTPTAAAGAEAPAGPGRAVLGFSEKGAGGPGWINAGVYFFPRAVVATQPVATPWSLERELLMPLAAAGRLRAVPSGGRFIDIGTPAAYALADGFFQAHEPPAASPEP